MIGLVDVTGIDAARRAYGLAGQALEAGLTKAVASDRSHRSLPWFGRSDDLWRLDTTLRESSAHLRQSLVHLDGIRVAPGAGADALEQVRAGVRELADDVDARRALDRPKERWRTQVRHVGELRAMQDLARGLKAIGDDTTGDWALGEAGLDWGVTTFLRHRDLVLPLDPATARMQPFFPSTTSGFDYRGLVRRMEPMLERGSPDRVATSDVFWNLLKQAWHAGSGWGSVSLGADDLRRMVAAAHPDLATTRLPAWLRDASGDSVQLTRERASDLALLKRPTIEHVEHDVSHALITDLRPVFARDGDYGRLMVDAARRLPDELRPEIPAGVEFDEALAMEWSRDVRTRRARSFVEGRDRDSGLVRDLLSREHADDRGSAIGASLVAHEVLAELPSDGRQVRDAVVTQLRGQVRTFLEANERAWHFDRAEFGRLQASSEFLARIDAQIAERAAAAARASGSGHMTW